MRFFRDNDWRGATDGLAFVFGFLAQRIVLDFAPDENRNGADGGGASNGTGCGRTDLLRRACQAILCSPRAFDNNITTHSRILVRVGHIARLGGLHVTEAV
jgi:hypothetical protein